MITDIIVIKYNVPILEKECIKSILEFTNGQETPYHLTIYDNYPKDEALSVIWNRLIAKSEADYICLLNSDTQVEQNWLKKMLEVFQKEVNIGLVGPTSNRVGGQQGRIKTSKEYAVSDVKYICGFCMIFPKSIWEKVRGFNERFFFTGEDNFFSWQVQKMGFRSVVRHDIFIFHHWHGSYREAQKRRGRSIRRFDARESERIFRELTNGAKNPDGRPSDINLNQFPKL